MNKLKCALLLFVLLIGLSPTVYSADGWEKGTDYGFSNWRVVLHTKAQSVSNPANVEDEWFMPKPSTTWQIQLQGDVNTNYGDAEMYDIDLYDSSEALIQQLQARGKNVICYFSAGSYENWRPDADQFNASDLGRALDGWPGERWLDIRSNNVREIMKRRLDLAEQKGCGGVDPDNMDGYLNESGLPINAQDQLSFNRFIAKEAHDRGLSVGLKNDLDQIEDLVDHFDFAVNEQCFQFNECDLLTPFINQGKAVFQIEYAQKYTTGANAEATRNKLCGDAQSLKLSTLVMPLLLDDEFRFSCLDENGSPELLSPLGTTTNPPVFKWNKVAGATRYKLFVNEYADPNVVGKIDQVFTAAEAGCTTNPVCEVSPNISFKIAAGEWWVTAFKGEASTLSDSGAFTIVLPGTPNGGDNDNSSDGDTEINSSSGGGLIALKWLVLFGFIRLFRYKLLT